ncbi:MAG TPA: VanZ family protein [Candidatus Mediterraneibacter intestinipullorum]|nr:VanZ family protein [Candidatus Mediterraneibacter intestinipullorum]
MNIRRKVFLIITVLWMVMIFSFSARPAEISSEDSRHVGLLVGEIFVPGFEDWTEAEREAFAERVDHPVRKTAHAAEFAALGLFVAGAYIEGGKPAGEKKDKKNKGAQSSGRQTGIGRGIFVSWLITAAYAATDEIHQLFVPGRSGQVSDVVLDSAGAMAGSAYSGGGQIFIRRRYSE